MEKESNQKICLKSGISTNQKKKKKGKKKTKIGEATTGNLTQLLKKQELWGISCNSEDAQKPNYQILIRSNDLAQNRKYISPKKKR